MKRNYPPKIVLLTSMLLLLLAGSWGCGGDSAPENRDRDHAEGEEHGGHSDEPEEHEEGRSVLLDAAVIERLGIELAVAGPGDLEVTVEIPGEVQVNGDHMAHVAPRVAGVAREVLVSLGDTVRAGQLLAVLESRELADAKAFYLAATEREGLANATFRREERLWKNKVSSEQDYLDASNGLAEARIVLRAARQKLHALGFDEEAVERISEQPDIEFTRYRVTAPFRGEVIERHITMGETISAGDPVFTVADLSTVWIDLSVYQKDLASVKAGQHVHLRPANNGVGGEGTIEFLQPLLGEDTRTALARITAPNPDSRWKPGMFVSAMVVTDAVQADLRVPQSALIRMEDGDEVVFVETGEGFEPRPVVLGRRSRDYAEVTSGLEPGERYVARGGFSLKAELGKDAFGDGHGH